MTEASADGGASVADTVGAQLRLLRRARRQTLRQVAERARVSESFLSQLERGRDRSDDRVAPGNRSGPRRRGLQPVRAPRGGTGPRVLRREDRPYVSWGTLGRKALLTPKPFEALEVVAASFERGGSTGRDTYVHGDPEELLVVVSGLVELTLGGRRCGSAPGTALATGVRCRTGSSMPGRRRRRSCTS